LCDCFGAPNSSYGERTARINRAWDSFESGSGYSISGKKERSRDIELVVDAGATFPIIPKELVSELAIQPSEKRTFKLADGTQIIRDMGWAGMAYDGRRSPALVVLGEPEDIPILGAIPLEGLGLEVDSVAKRLRPVTQFLLTLNR